MRTKLKFNKPKETLFDSMKPKQNLNNSRFFSNMKSNKSSVFIYVNLLKK